MDRITLDILWNRLIATTNEQASALMRSSFTSVVRDAGDLSAAVFDRRARMVAQAVTGTPGHINSLATGMVHFLERFPIAELHPGDVLVTNDPWKTASQLHDITVVTPIFRGDRLIAFFGSCCHTEDIGGRGLSADARSIFEEGLLIPLSKLYDRGKPVELLFEIIRNNVRTPEEALGDLHSQVVGNSVGGKQLLSFLDEFGLDDIEALSDALTERTEKAMRERITSLPAGEYRYELTADGFDAPLTLKTRIVVAGDELLIDFAGSSGPSALGNNVCLNYTKAYTVYGLKCALSPDIPNNDGTFRPIRIIAPDNCILNARRPAAVCGRHLVGHMLPSLIMGALAQTGTEKIMAPGYDSLWESHVVWADETHGRMSAFTWFSSGGTGALMSQDGLSATAYPSGVASVSAELIEARAPLRVVERSLRIDSGGAGTYRGGLGQTLELEVGARNPVRFSGIYERLRNPAPGMNGGEPGGVGHVACSGGRTFKPATAIAFEPGTRIRLELPGGGGMGRPEQREPQRVLADVVNGYVSLESARDIYGVCIDETDLCIDEARTRARRNVDAGKRRTLKEA